MIKTRIAGTAALVTFGLAALGGAAVAIAAPANAEGVPAPGSAASQPHVLFPKSQHEPHERLGRKGSDGINAVPQPHDLLPIFMGTVSPKHTRH
jgi:hypothetical protein